MPKTHTERLVPYSPEQMFSIVADVERYPEFVPYCAALRVKDKNERAVIAAMTVKYLLLEEVFTSRVVLDEAQQRIDVSLISGPFRKLENQWQFVAAGSGTNIIFDLDYEFKSLTLGLVMGAAFKAMYQRFVDSFEKRAAALYK